MPTTSMRPAWRRHAEPATRAALTDLVGYATLAASSHNSQPWTFSLRLQSIAIVPDFSRRCPATDPDDHHLFVSLGCAAENLAHAALAYGLYTHAYVGREYHSGVDLLLEPTQAIRTRLFDAIPERQCTRTRYDGLPISRQDIAALSAAGQGNGVDMLLLTGKLEVETVLESIIAASTAQMADRAVVKELKTWMRFNEADARRTGDGLFVGTMGSRTAPAWLGRLFFERLFTERSQRQLCAEHVRSSTGIAIFSSDVDDKTHWVEAGRSYERFALQATAIGVRNAFLNQAVEVESVRRQLATWLGLGDRRIDLIVRFGRGPRMPRSLRRPLYEVLL
jgi:hypothetical protein